LVESALPAAGCLAAARDAVPDAVCAAWTAADLHAWHVLAPLSREYAPWSSASLRPSALVAVLNDVLVHGRRAVLECGGGVSTLYLGRLLERLGAGALLTVEHDQGWAAFLERALAREGLGRRARVVHAPLAEHPLGWESPWYDEEALRAPLPQDPIDLLLVDGPPAWAAGTERSRYPALPVLLGDLAADATVVLDDVQRAGERAVLERWEAETPLRFERRPEPGGIAIARRGVEGPLGA
jgi:methyltransferase family protein